MSNRQIICPMSWGSGAYIANRYLEQYIPEYKLESYHPCWTLMPFALPLVASTKNAALIHTTPAYASFFHRKSTPLIITFQNYFIDPWMRSYSSFAQRIHYSTDLRLWIRRAVKKAHTITAVSKFTARLIQHDLCATRPIRIIYNSVDLGSFTPKQCFAPNRKEIRVFYSGNLSRRKGSQWLLSIAKQLKKNICIYYTQGLRTRSRLPIYPQLKSIGPVSFEEMPERYREMDILLMPTVREGFSLSVLEAMAGGLPVVASDCSSLPEQIENGKGGFLCPVGDVKAFADKINFLADSSKLRREMGEYNRCKVERFFSVHKMVKQYKELFEEVLS
ncbi:MAG TPA: glycosyltransferase family 1 protein [Desulfobacteraceae bacterium]|nr:glycosyltransferase family 1 protein [Desulfobacteraceae bacterium]